MATNSMMEKKPDLMAGGTTAAIAIAGGVAGNYITGMVEKQSFMAGKTQYAPYITAALGVLVSVFVADKNIKAAGLGMAAVAGTESVEQLMAKSATPPVNGVPATPRQLGQRSMNFVPQYIPKNLRDGNIRTAAGVAVR